MFRIARLEAAIEPLHALLGGTVGETVGNDAARGLLLQAVIANSGGGIHGFFDVTHFRQALLLYVLTPHARKTIGL